MIEYKGTLEFSDFLLDLSKEMAITRSKLSEKVYNDKTEKYRGEEEFRISKQGVLGELIAREHFKQITKPTTFWKFAPIIDATPLPEPDLIINKFKVDIKCISSDIDLFMINEKSHKNPDKEVDLYWFIRLIGNCNCEHWIIRSKDVDDWDLKQMKYTKAYIKRIPEDKKWL